MMIGESNISYLSDDRLAQLPQRVHSQAILATNKMVEGKYAFLSPHEPIQAPVLVYVSDRHNATFLHGLRH